MARKLLVYILLLVFMMGSAFALEPAEQQSDASYGISDVNNETNTETAPILLENNELNVQGFDASEEELTELKNESEKTDKPTQLFIELSTDREKYANGDMIRFTVKVTNVGKNPALMTKVSLENIPADWTFYPPTNRRNILLIMPGRSKQAVFDVKKGQTESDVFATAKAENSLLATSELIPIPVLWTTVAMVPISMILLTIYFKRKNLKSP